MNSSRLKAILFAVKEGAPGPPQLSIHDAVRAEFEGYLEAADGGGWALTPKANGWGQAAANGAAQNIVTQGIGLALGLQDKFSWASVAAAGVGAGVAEGAFSSVKLNALPRNSAAYVARTAQRATASALANAATRSVIQGTDFGDNVLAALPDVIGQTIGEAIAGGISGTSASRQGASEGERQGSFFGAIGDWLGFDGEFGYDGLNGPTGAGRNLSLAGVGGAIGDFVGLDGQFGQQGMLQRSQVAYDGPVEVYERELALRNLGRAVGGAARVGARALGGLAGPLVDLAFAQPTGGAERVTLIEGDAHLRIRQPHSDTLSFVLEQSEPGFFGVRWNRVGGVERQWVDDNTDLHDGSPGHNFYVVPDETAAALGRDLDSRVFYIIDPQAAQPETWQTPPSIGRRETCQVNVRAQALLHPVNLARGTCPDGSRGCSIAAKRVS